MAKRNPFQLYKVQSFEDAARKAQRFTDAGGIIIARNLEYLSTEIFTQEYPELTFLQQGVVINNEGGYADSIKKLKLAIAGDFREAGTNTNTTGKITLEGEDDNIPVFSMDAESDWSEIELKKAELQNINLPSRFVEAHSEVYNRKIDSIGYIGHRRTNGTIKAPGLLTYTGWDTDVAATTAENMTAQELYDALAGLLTRQWANVFNVAAFKADHVVMPYTVYNIASTSILNSAAGSLSALKSLQDNFPGVTWGMTDKAEAGQAGASSVTVAMSTNRRGMQFRIPVPLEISPIDQRGFKYYMESYFAIAGLDVIEDGAAATLSGL